jgi:hypothetical protein
VQQYPGGSPVPGQNPLFLGDCSRNPTAGQAYTGFAGSQSGNPPRSITGLFHWIGGPNRSGNRKMHSGTIFAAILEFRFIAVPVIHGMKTGRQGRFC